MSSSPTGFHYTVKVDQRLGFKALSRMSSSPTINTKGAHFGGWVEFQSAVAHELFSDEENRSHRPYRCSVFQSAVAHELFSDIVDAAGEADARTRFKALSRMSSSPTMSKTLPRSGSACFKALSRMSSSPTHEAGAGCRGT